MTVICHVILPLYVCTAVSTRVIDPTTPSGGLTRQQFDMPGGARLDIDPATIAKVCGSQHMPTDIPYTLMSASHNICH